MNLQSQEILIGFLCHTDLETVIQKSSIPKDVMKTLKTALEYCDKKYEVDDDKLFEIDSVIDFLHDELNTGHWSEVPIESRQMFTCASFLKCVAILKSEEISQISLKKCLKCLDLGLLLGAPLDDNELLQKSATYLTKLLSGLQKSTEIDVKATKKCCLDHGCHESFKSIDAQEISMEECPSIECFNKSYFVPQTPVKLTGCMNHWPASAKWLDVNYLLSIAANRTVPIEIGSHYVDTNWSQKLMTFEDFIRNHYLSEDGDIGYLAQYNLFDHITELREDICTPEYCCLSLDYENSSEPDINAWLGPKGTVSPLHFDPKNNILAQVYGTKQIILFDPKDTPYLYPHESKMLSNTSQVDPLKKDLAKFPELTKAKMYKCLLEPGEMLFIPQQWWHHVTALDKSFSVSFWWQ